MFVNDGNSKVSINKPRWSPNGIFHGNIVVKSKWSVIDSWKTAERTDSCWRDQVVASVLLSHHAAHMLSSYSPEQWILCPQVIYVGQVYELLSAVTEGYIWSHPWREEKNAYLCLFLYFGSLRLQ